MEDSLSELPFSKAFLISIGLAAAYYFMVFKTSDPEIQISMFKEEIAQYEGEIKKFDKKIEESEKLKEKIKILEKDISVKYSYISRDTDKGDVLQSLSVEARKAGLNIENVSEPERWKPMDNMEYLEVPLSLSGDFSQVMLFLSSLTQQKKLIVTRQFVLSVNEDGGLDPNLGRPKSVKLDVTVRVFRKLAGSDEFKSTSLTGEADNV